VNGSHGLSKWGASKHGPARGYARPPFERGNEIATKHGSYALVGLAPRAEELAAGLREVVPVASMADETAIALLALTLARVERATAALDRLDEIGDESGSALSAYTSSEAQKFDRLREDLRGWLRLARTLCSDLGLTPVSRAKLGLDIARAESEVGRLVDVGRAIVARRDGEAA